MEKRFDPKTLAPEIFDAQIKLGMAVKTCGLDLALIELAQVRASQINGCAYCLILHLANARKAGVSQRKLDLLAAWRDTPDFDARISRMAACRTKPIRPCAKRSTRRKSRSSASRSA